MCVVFLLLDCRVRTQFHEDADDILTVISLSLSSRFGTF